jgi:transcriptional regulator with XRE-family HTH domain
MNQVEQLREIKENRALSFEGMSREIGVSYRTLFRWLHGKNAPSFLATERLNEYLRKQNPKMAELEARITEERR